MYDGEYDGDPEWYPGDDEYEPMTPYEAIEPMAGETYSEEGYACYRYSEYPLSSVLAGQARRSFLGGPYKTAEEAKTAHPDAEWSGEGSGYTAPVIPSEPPSWFDPANAGESWDGE